MDAPVSSIGGYKYTASGHVHRPNELGCKARANHSLIVHQTTFNGRGVERLTFWIWQVVPSIQSVHYRLLCTETIDQCGVLLR